MAHVLCDMNLKSKQSSESLADTAVNMRCSYVCVYKNNVDVFMFQQQKVHVHKNNRNMNKSIQCFSLVWWKEYCPPARSEKKKLMLKCSICYLLLELSMSSYFRQVSYASGRKILNCPETLLKHKRNLPLKLCNCQEPKLKVESTQKNIRRELCKK